MSFIVETKSTGPRDTTLMPCGGVVELQHFIDYIRPVDRPKVEALKPRERCIVLFNPMEDTGRGVEVEVYRCPGGLR